MASRTADPLEELVVRDRTDVDDVGRALARAVVRTGIRWRALSLVAPTGRREDVAAFVAWAVLVERSASDPELRAALARDVTAIERADGGLSVLAAALAAACDHGGVPTTGLRPWLAGVERTEVGFATREELVAHARRRSEPPVEAFSTLFELESERDRSRAAALGLGWRLSDWTRHVGREWRAGRLVVPGDDLARAGAAPRDVAEGRATEALRVVLAELADEALRELAKAWPLALDLPWPRGVALAAILRWHGAALRELREGRGDASLGAGVEPPPSAWPGFALRALRRSPAPQDLGRDG